MPKGHSRLRGRFLSVLMIITVLLSAVVPVARVRAATFTVTSTLDFGPGSLRQAIQDTESNPGADTITFEVTGTIVLAQGELAISDDLTIEGPGASDLVISGNNTSRIFNIQAATTSISGLRITGGSAVSGGAINVDPEAGLVISGDTRIDGNAADEGGAVRVLSGRLTMTGGEISGNTSSLGGGGVFIDAASIFTMSGGSIQGNTAQLYGGGGLYVRNESSATISGGQITGNTTTTELDALVSGGGIALEVSSLTMTGGTISGNLAGNQGGGLWMDDRSIATITNTTISGNRAGAGGGGHGGGLWNSGSLDITSSTIANNQSDAYAGGIYNKGSFSLINSTISGNTAGDDGGGIMLDPGASTTIANSTITNNRANGAPGVGGGVFSYFDGAAGSISNSILSGNFGTPGDEWNYDCYLQSGLTSAGNNLFGSGGCPAGGAGDISNTDPQLGPLENNGGPTLTHALKPSSPAVDNGNASTPGTGNGACEATDQRGIARPKGAACDIGAYEGTALVVTSTADSGPGTLRDILAEANSTRGTDAIYFNISGAGPHIIAPASALPWITEAVSINGYTQPGASPNTLPVGNNARITIGLDGSNLSFSALVISTSGVTVKGLAIYGGFNDGIALDGGSGNTVAGNFIGLTTSGAASGNNASGIYLNNTANNQIGGTSPEDRNVISANRDGLFFASGGGTNSGNVVQGNYIGTNPAGTAVGWGNNEQGIEMGTFGCCFNNGNTIGGTAVGAGNVISGNGGDGIMLNGWAVTGNQIQGNVIGVAANGTTALGNGGNGVLIADSSTNSIGGTAPRAGNVIAYNGNDGVRVEGGTENAIQGNSIYNNREQGIDLANDGITANDDGDIDEGPNNWQNFPMLSFPASSDRTTTITGTLTTAADSDFEIQFYGSDSCEPSGFGEGQRFIGSTTATTDGNGSATFSASLASVEPLGAFVTATATDAAGNTSEFSACQRVVPSLITRNNGSWTTAHELVLAENGAGVFQASVDQHLAAKHQSAWFKFQVKPGGKVFVALSNLPENYDLTLYRDIADAYKTLTSPQDLLEQTAEFAPDYFSPDYFSPDYFSPDYFSPDYFSPDYFSPDYFSPDYFSPDYFSPDSSTVPPAKAYSNAQRRSLVSFSAREGTADELAIQNTWEMTGDFYVRVRGRAGTFSTDAPFHLEATMLTGACGSINPVTTTPTIGAVAGNYKTIILTDYGRLDGSAFGKQYSTNAEVDTLRTRLATFAGRTEVAGVVVNVGNYARYGLVGDARVMAANVQADQYTDCPYAKNLVAQATKDIIDAYRVANPALEYIVIVGNDDVVPFWRHPEQVGLGKEKDYDPPVRDATSSQASLKLSYVLGQDRYGAQVELSSLNRTLPVPDLAVGRLVETAAEATGMLDAYLKTNGGVVATPTSALVTGYDFLTPAAEAVRDQLEAGLGVTANTLISARDLAVTAPACTAAFDPKGKCNWTAGDLRSKLLGSRHDLIYLAGHFSQAGALAGDYKTRLGANEVAASAVNLENAIVFSTGCHSGYNTVDEHAVGGATETPDWAQAAARKRFTLIGGTGYQYGDTEVLEYGARLYHEFSKRLRMGSGPVALGKALVDAKNHYLGTTVEMRGIHDKTVVQATLYGLPMLSVNLPGQRLNPNDPSVIDTTTRVGPADAGLSRADLSVTPFFTTETASLTNVNDDTTVTATYLSATHGVVANPDAPILPLEIRNVSVPNTVLRGVGFRGGTYADLENTVPLVSAPTTELRSVRSSFYSDRFFPNRPWSVNYFDALANGGDGATRLHVTPAQFISKGLGSLKGTLRKHTKMDFRLFYSSNIGTIALAGAPMVSAVSTLTSNGLLQFDVDVDSDPASGIQEVWVTYTSVSPSSPFYGKWQSLDLSEDSGDTGRWTGKLALGSGSAEEIRFMVQAASYGGLVTLDTNTGTFYIPGDAPPTPVQVGTVLTLELPKTAGFYTELASFSAQLRNAAGESLADQPVVFTLGTQRIATTTNSDGRATGTLRLLQLPGQYEVNATFPESASYSSSAASGGFTINKLNTTLRLVEPKPGTYDTSTPVVATLTDSAGRALHEKTVFFVVDGPGGPYIKAATTDYQGQAPLSLSLGGGTFTFRAYFGGDVLMANGELIALHHAQYAASSATQALQRTQYIYLPLIRFAPDPIMIKLGQGSR